MDSNQPKTLIISHNCLSSTTSMGRTIASLFSSWHPDRIAQLYFRNEIPSSNVCNKYFRVTDNEVLKSIFKADECGSAILPHCELSETDLQNTAYKLGSYRIPLINIIRDGIWKSKKWDTVRLNEWICEFSPEVIFLVPGDYCFAYDVAYQIANKHNIPVVIYFTDDYIHNKFSLSPFYWIKQRCLQNTSSRVVGYSSSIMTICNKMTEEYEEYFNKKGEIFMNSVPPNAKYIPRSKNDGAEIRISYMGNLHSNRWRTISMIGHALKELELEGYNSHLYVYSASQLNPRIIRKLEESKKVTFIGSVDAEGVIQAQIKSDILVHVEAFDKKSRQTTRLSISTKIPEYLSSGRCIFAFGPEDVASIQYLIETGVAEVCTDIKNVRKSLERILGSYNIREQYAEKAFCLAHKEHNSVENSNKFKLIINEARRKNQNEQSLTV